MGSKLFYLGLPERSVDPYRWLQKVFPIPSFSNLNIASGMTFLSNSKEEIGDNFMNYCFN